MSLITARPTTPSRRHYVRVKTEFTKIGPKRSLLGGLKHQHSGRNSTGAITVRHRGGGHKRKLRVIDFKRNKPNIPGLVKAIEYDPNRSSNLARIIYPDGDQRYILAPVGLALGDTVVAGAKVDVGVGNCMTLENIPVGTPIHNIEIKPGKGGQLVRSAGSSALIQSKENQYATVQMPSKELRLIRIDCLATIGQVSNPDHQNRSLGKAGRKRHMGIRPGVRGTAQHPGAHPHGGGEGRSGAGMKYSKTPWGKPAMGKKTRKKVKYSNKYIIRDRRVK